MYIFIPTTLTSDFLGTFAIDILHDTKKQYSIFSNKKLAFLTDIIADIILAHNSHKKPLKLEIQQFVFYSVLQYFIKLWQDNLTNSLNIIDESLFYNSNYQELRDIVTIPLKYSWSGEYWIPVNKTNTGGLIEYNNYIYQCQYFKPIV